MHSNGRMELSLPDAKGAEEEDGADTKGPLDLVACCAPGGRGEERRAGTVEEIEVAQRGDELDRGVGRLVEDGVAEV